VSRHTATNAFVPEKTTWSVPADPEVDDELAVADGRERRAHLAALGEVARELVGDRAEAGRDVAGDGRRGTHRPRRDTSPRRRDAYLELAVSISRTGCRTERDTATGRPRLPATTTA
jgi:hypothetical protein